MMSVIPVISAQQFINSSSVAGATHTPEKSAQRRENRLDRHKKKAVSG
jgi:hypothetical protein